MVEQVAEVREVLSQSRVGQVLLQVGLLPSWQELGALAAMCRSLVVLV